MKNRPPSSHTAQTCLVSLISLNQLKRQFQLFQQTLFSQLSLLQKQSMQDIISLWKLFSHTLQSQPLANHVNKKIPPATRQKNSFELQFAYDTINQKQQHIQELSSKLSEAQEAKQELLNILQRQTELCTQIRDEQIDQATTFNRKINAFQKNLYQKQTLIGDLKVQTSVLKRLLKEEYQLKAEEPEGKQEYVSATTRFMKPRKSDGVGVFVDSSNKKRNSMSKSKELLKGTSLKSSTTIGNFSKTMKVNESTQSIKSQIEKIIQKAVKQNCQKYKK